MRTLRENTQAGRLLKVLVERYPLWSNVEHFGYDGYSCRNRMDDALGARGLTIDRRPLVRDEGHPGTSRRTRLFEWRLLNDEIYSRACLLVRSWTTGEDYETLVANDARLAREIARREEREREEAAAARTPTLFD